VPFLAYKYISIKAKILYENLKTIAKSHKQDVDYILNYVLKMII